MSANTTIQNIPGWLTTLEAADALGVTREYVYLLTRKGYLSGVSIGGGQRGVRMYRESDVRNYKASHPRLGRHRGSRSRSTLAERILRLLPS